MQHLPKHHQYIKINNGVTMGAINVEVIVIPTDKGHHHCKYRL